MDDYKLLSILINSSLKNSIQQHTPPPTKVNACLEKCGWHRKRPKRYRYSFILHTDDYTYIFTFVCMYAHIKWHVDISLWFWLLILPWDIWCFPTKREAVVWEERHQAVESYRVSCPHWWAERPRLGGGGGGSKPLGHSSSAVKWWQSCLSHSVKFLGQCLECSRHLISGCCHTLALILGIKQCGIWCPLLIQGLVCKPCVYMIPGTCDKYSNELRTRNLRSPGEKI